MGLSIIWTKIDKMDRGMDYWLEEIDRWYSLRPIKAQKKALTRGVSVY